jgi:hypothetical protein
LRRTLELLKDSRRKVKMATRTQELAKTNTAVTLTDLITEGEILHYPDLSGIDRLSFQIRAAYVRYSRDTILYVLGLLQRLKGKNRIYERSYPRHPYLKHRFIPPPKESDLLPPLFLDIHGGGFIMGDP